MTAAAPRTIFQDAASGALMVPTATFPKPLITPLHVFAARREVFDVIVRRTWSSPRAVAAIFEALPLAENGWDIATVKAVHVGNSEGLYPIWRLERGV